MKTTIVGVILAVVLGAAGYFALPVLIERKTEGLRTEIRQLNQRLENAEKFINAENEARKSVRLEPGADATTITRSVNALAARVTTLEGSVRKEMATMNAVVKGQQASTAAALKRQAETLEKESGEIRGLLRGATFKGNMAEVRGRLLKVKTDLLANNIGTADAEVGVLVEVLEKMKETVLPETRKVLDAAQANLRTARGEMTADLPAAMKRVDLLWHDVGNIKN